jgi:hypothetical protein
MVVPLSGQLAQLAELQCGLVTSHQAYCTAVELDGQAAHPAEDPLAAQVARVLADRGFVGARQCSAACPVSQMPGRHHPAD